MADNRSDEQLVLAYKTEGETSVNLLLARYQEQLYYYILKNGWSKDKQILDDILQEVLLTILKALRAGKFEPSGPGSFRAWAYTVALNVCRTQNRLLSYQPKTVSGLVLAKQVGIRDNIIAKVSARLGEYTEKNSALDDALSQLSLEDQQLLKMVTDGKKYKEIRQELAFANYSIDYLMRKVYIARNKVKRILKERTKKV